ncbi:MAG: TPR repeat protein [Porticoccus sp.]|jgi:TPR repeat protein
MYHLLLITLIAGLLAACSSTFSNNDKTKTDTNLHSSDDKLRSAESYYKNNQPEKALTLYQQAANDGNARAQGELGLIYVLGALGVK